MIKKRKKDLANHLAGRKLNLERKIIELLSSRNIITQIIGINYVC